MSKEVKFSVDARSSMLKGIETLYNATRITLGPKGRNAIIEQDFGYPLITNDGVTIAKSIELANHFENMAASLIIEAASTTNDLVGDGTTTAIILASNLIFEGLKVIDSGISPVLIKNKLEEALEVLLKYIDEVSIEIKDLDDLEKIAYISSSNKKVSSVLKNAYLEVGKNGIITIEESKTSETYLDIVKGYMFDKGYLSPYMINNSEKALAELVNPYILITNQKITSMNTIVPFLEVAISKGQPILIICEDIESEVLNTIVLNKLRGVFNCVVVKAPYYGEKQRKTLEDLAIVSNAVIVNNTIDNSIVKEKLLGSAARVIVKKDSTTIIDGNANNALISQKIDELKKQYAIESSSYEKNELLSRMSKISGKAAVIKVGAQTETSLKELRMRTEDALNATVAALDSGIIEGGGKVFFELAEKLNELNIDLIVKNMLEKTLKAPFYQILDNAGVDKDLVLSQINHQRWYDASNNTYGSNIEKGIIDPASVAKTTIKNAIAVASLFLTTECAIVNNNDHQKEDNELM